MTLKIFEAEYYPPTTALDTNFPHQMYFSEKQVKSKERRTVNDHWIDVRENSHNPGDCWTSRSMSLGYSVSIECCPSLDYPDRIEPIVALRWQIVATTVYPMPLAPERTADRNCSTEEHPSMLSQVWFPNVDAITLTEPVDNFRWYPSETSPCH